MDRVDIETSCAAGGTASRWWIAICGNPVNPSTTTNSMPVCSFLDGADDMHL